MLELPHCGCESLEVFASVLGLDTFSCIIENQDSIFPCSLEECPWFTHLPSVLTAVPDFFTLPVTPGDRSM